MTVDKEQLEEVLSKLHDVRDCITAKSVCIDLGISRKDACRLLEVVIDDVVTTTGKNCVYEVTRYFWKVNARGARVATLHQSHVSKDNPALKSAGGEGPIYSIAVAQNNENSQSAAKTPTPKSGHAYTMTLLRDALETSNASNVTQQPKLVTPLSPTLACDSIHPASGKDRVEMMEVGAARSNRIAALSEKGCTKDNSIRSSKSTNNGSSKKQDSFGVMKRNSSVTSTSGKSSNKKTVSAASFFGKPATKSSKVSKTTTTAIKSKTKSKPPVPSPKSKKQKEQEEIIDSDEDEEYEFGDEDMEEEQEYEIVEEAEKTKINKSSTSTKQTKKTKTKTKKSTKTSVTTTSSQNNIGTADDFVGDEDEDEEFLQQDEERKQRNATRERSLIREKAFQEQRIRKGRNLRNKGLTGETDDGDEEMMDIDNDNGENGKKKRRKKKEAEWGAMDTFASSKKRTEMESNEEGENSQDVGNTFKRRKKVFEEKTYKDDSGYFHTETVAVWKEVPDDEGERREQGSSGKNNGKVDRRDSAKSSTGGGGSSSKKVQKPKIKNTKKMKQQGLMGFFSVKK